MLDEHVHHLQVKLLISKLLQVHDDHAGAKPVLDGKMVFCKPGCLGGRAWEYGILYVMQHTLWIKCFPELGYVNEPKDVNVGVNDLLDFGEYFGEQ